MISSIDLIAYNNVFENPPTPRGTLYQLATNVDNHRIFLYNNRSESIKQAANRFLLMHKYPLVAGGYAGRFLRASSGLIFVSNAEAEAEFRYNLDHEGRLKVMRYKVFQNAWVLFFEGDWYSFVNQYSEGSERLHAFPHFRSQKLRIMTASEAKAKIKNLEHLSGNKPLPEKLKKYLGFVDILKKLVTKNRRFD